MKIEHFEPEISKLKVLNDQQEEKLNLLISLKDDIALLKKHFDEIIKPENMQYADLLNKINVAQEQISLLFGY